MSKVAIEVISRKLIEIYDALLYFHKKYNNLPNDSNKRTNYFNYVRTYQDFYGYLISLRNLIEQYYDNFVILVEKLILKLMRIH
jgi:hypothetical protein